MRLASPTASVYHLMVDGLNSCCHTGINERASKMFGLAVFRSLRDKVERSIDR
jgi:hypothetical protein